MRSSRRLYTMWFAAIVLISLLYIARMVQENSIVHRYEEIVRVNGQVMRLSEQAEEITSLLERHYAFYDKDALPQLRERIDAFLSVASRNRPDIYDTDLLFFYRTHQNMLEHIREVMEGPSSSSNYQLYYGNTGLRKRGEYFVDHVVQYVFSAINANMLYYDTILRESRQTVQLLNLFAILALAILGVLLVLTGNVMIRDINRISRQALMLSDGNWNIADIKGSRHAEINNVIQALNTMKQNTFANIRLQRENAELEKNYRDERISSLEKDHLLREAKIKALQMQINPHFLFNTFNMISRSALLEDGKTTISLIESISSIMRYTMSNESMAALGDEIATLNAYLKIQRVRFQDTMDLTCAVSDKSGVLSDIPVPPLIIQPLVENAIIHGITDISYRGKVDITICHDGEYLDIVVADNGKGMDCERLEHVKSQMGSVGDRMEIGIGNVAGRLEYFYGRPGLMEISSTPGKGTQVSISVPTGLLYPQGQQFCPPDEKWQKG